MAIWAQLPGTTYLGHESYKHKRDNSQERNTPQNRYHGYAIQVKSFTGNNHKNEAAATFDTLNRIYNISQLWVIQNADKTIIYRGRFESKTSFQANRALSQIERLMINNRYPFRNAIIVSLGGNTALDAKLAKYDLRNVEGRYSFQVGVFTDSLPDYKKHAEQWTQELRKQGYESYFYHTRFKTSVTIGVFTEKEAYNDVYRGSSSERIFSKEILDLKRKFPINIINGHKAYTSDDKETPLESFLVEIPAF